MHRTKPALGRVPPVLHLRCLLTQCAALGLIGLAVASCGLQKQSKAGSGSPAVPSQSPSASGSPAEAGHSCTAAQLKVTLDLKSAGVAAGTSLIPLDFTNTSAVSCDLAGFANVSFVTASAGQQVGPAATVDRSLSPRSLRLVAGDSAHLWLRLAQTANLPSSTCAPKAVAGLLVKLPGQATSIFVRHQFTTCAKRLRGTEILTVEPFQAGLARAGTAQ